MFATASRSRRHGSTNARSSASASSQESSDPPPAGCDSCFDVRSLNGSEMWEPSAPEHVQAPQPDTPEQQAGILEGEDGDALAAAVAVATEEGIADRAQAAARESVFRAEVDEAQGAHGGQAEARSSADADAGTIQARSASILDSPPTLAPSPALFLPTLSTSISNLSSPLPQSSRSSRHAPLSEYSTDTDEEYPDHGEGYEDEDDDVSSAPPSPTSLTSFTAYLASDASFPGSPGLGYTSDPGSLGAQSPSRSRSPGGRRLGSIAAALARARRGVPAHRRDIARAFTGADVGQVEEGLDLVIPTLSLPSSSLHLSFRHYMGPMESIKIALAGDGECIKAFLRALGRRETLVDVGKKGAVGVVRGGKLAVVLLTGFSALQIRGTAIASYTALHSLLNPASSPTDRGQAQLRGLVTRYAEREEWIHAWLALDDLPPLDQAAVSKILHPLSPGPQNQIQTADTRSRASSPVGSPAAAEPPQLDEPTPMAHTEFASYFQQPLSVPPPTSPIPESETSSETDGSTIAAVRSLRDALDSPSDLVAESVDRFLAWRPVPLDSSDSSLGTTSAGTSGAAGLDREFPAMPTVARAQGGGEWQAGFSRRVAAKRRETDSATTGSARTAGSKGSTGAGSGAASSSATVAARRRRSKGSRDASGHGTMGGSGPGGARTIDPHEPLFPPSSTSASSARNRPGPIARGLGMSELIGKTFAPIRKGLQGWKGMLMFAAVVGVVGFGWWIGKRA